MSLKGNLTKKEIHSDKCKIIKLLYKTFLYLKLNINYKL